MSAPLKAGDLAMVVHRCCAKSLSYGTVLTVQRLERQDIAICNFCNLVVTHARMAYFGLAGSRSYPAHWLRRLDPPSADETTRTDEEITA